MATSDILDKMADLSIMDKHAPLITSMTSFYKLLIDMAYLAESDLILPDATTKRHKADAIDREAAKAAGFDDEVIELMYHLPYLREFYGEMPIAWETEHQSYLKDSVSDFTEQRDPMWQGRNDIPSHAMMITKGMRDGTVLVYDVNNCKSPHPPPCAERSNRDFIGRMTNWVPMHEDPAYDDYQHLPSQQPEEIIGEWMQKYRMLIWIPSFVCTYARVLAIDEIEEPLPDEVTGEEREELITLQDELRADAGLRDVYIEHGWQEGAVEQPTFNKDDFIQARESWHMQRYGTGIRGDYTI